jgi:hypothetical protein
MPGHSRPKDDGDLARLTSAGNTIQFETIVR